jgi:hypothetical protein
MNVGTRTSAAAAAGAGAGAAGAAAAAAGSFGRHDAPLGISKLTLLRIGFVLEQQALGLRVLGQANAAQVGSFVVHTPPGLSQHGQRLIILLRRREDCTLGVLREKGSIIARRCTFKANILPCLEKGL